MASAKASAADTQVAMDIQCFVIGVRLSASLDEMQRRAGEMLMIYSWGRLQGRSAVTNLEKLISNEAKRMKASDIGNVTRRCGADLSAQGKRIAEIGKSMQASGN